MDHEPIFKTTLADMAAEWEADAEESDDPEWTRERNWTACLMIMDYGISA